MVLTFYVIVFLFVEKFVAITWSFKLQSNILDLTLLYLLWIDFHYVHYKYLMTARIVFYSKKYLKKLTEKYKRKHGTRYDLKSAFEM